MKVQTQIFIFESTCSSNQANGSCPAAPPQTLTCSGGLQWDRSRLSTLLKGFSLVVNVGKLSVSFKLPWQHTQTKMGASEDFLSI